MQVVTSSVAGGEGELVAAQAQVIGVCVNHDGSPHHGELAGQSARPDRNKKA